MPNKDVATFGSGCFWCSEAVFSELNGVIGVVPGYAGGTLPNPTYEDVCSDKTGHAEVAQITFDPSLISYRELLEVLFSTHDPTTLNRQGADEGTQYRSVIFYADQEQKMQAEAIIRELTAVPERGWAVEREEGNIGVSCVAAPIFGPLGDVAAALSVTGPSQLVRADRIGPAVRMAAAAASRAYTSRPRPQSH